MDISEIKKGMLVECQQGTGTVLVVDEANQSVLIEERASHHQFAAQVDELVDDPQLHFGCDQYY